VASTAEEVRKTLVKIARAAVGNAFAVESVGLFDLYQGKGCPRAKRAWRSPSCFAPLIGR